MGGALTERVQASEAISRAVKERQAGIVFMVSAFLSFISLKYNTLPSYPPP